MIGVILLLIALRTYFMPRHRWISYALYTNFMMDGFCLLTTEIIGIKNSDLAVIYTFIISVYLLFKQKYRFPQVSFIKQYKWLLAFLACSVLFSLFYYRFGAFYVLQGSRAYLLLFALPVLCRIKPLEFKKLMTLFMWITTATAILYSLQVAVGHPLMPYGEYHTDSTTGLARFYNFPPFNTFFLTLSFMYPAFFGKQVNVFRIIYFTALMCTLGRTGIFTSIMTVGIAMYFNGKAGKLLKTTLIIGILFIPFMDMISTRFEKGNTDDDLKTILKGGAASYENANDGGTMTYRIAWILERTKYLLDRPIGEKIFGLGLITDSYPKLKQKYRFRLGLYNHRTGEIAQMSTPDIAYGNLISHWGFGGTIVYLTFMVSFAFFLYKHRKDNPFATTCAASIIMLFASSFAGSALSSPQNLIIYYIVISNILAQRFYAQKSIKYKQKTNEDSPYRIRSRQSDVKLL